MDSQPKFTPLKEAEKAVLDRLRTPVGIVDSTGIIQFSNKQTQTDFGNVDGKHIQDYLKDKNELPRIIRETYKAHKKFEKGITSDDIRYPVAEVKISNGRTKHLFVKPFIVGSGKNIDSVQFELIDQTREVANESLNKVALLIRDKPTLEDVFTSIREEINKVLPYDTANIQLFDSKKTANKKSLVTRYKWGLKNGGVKVLEKDRDVDYESKHTYEYMMQPPYSPLAVSDVNGSRYYSVVNDSPTQSWVGSPLVINGEVVGFVNLQSNTKGFYSAEDATLLSEFSTHISRAIQNSIRQEQLYTQATQDPLTGLFARRHFFEVSEIAIKEARRSKKPVSAVLIDIDNFKHVNDSVGHAGGDDVLRELGKRVQTRSRGSDISGRYGGEELAGTLQNTDISDAYQFAESLRTSIRSKSIATGLKTIDVTGSIGIAQATADDTVDSLLAHSDEAMYVVKKNGKDSVGVYLPETKINVRDGKVNRFEQVVVIKPKVTTDLTDDPNLRTMLAEVEPNYFEVEVHKKKSDLEDKIDSKEKYEKFMKYRIYETKYKDGTSRHTVFRVEFGQQSKSHVAALTIGPIGKSGGSYYFAPSSVYDTAIEHGIPPEDSFAWVSVLFPMKKFSAGPEFVLY